MANPQGVFEAGMQGAWIDQIGKGKLADTAQPLEHRTIDDLCFGAGKADKIKDRVADLSGFTHFITLKLKGDFVRDGSFFKYKKCQ